MQYGHIEVIGEIGVLTLDYPPVNALGSRTISALDEGFRTFLADGSVKAIVLACAGRTFVAGADISEISELSSGPDHGAVFNMVENGGKPVIAAIHGTALGGGYELSLMCHYRIAVPSAKVGLPEVKLGLLPGGGGTQRLPRIVGIEAALDFMTKGDPVPAPKALELGMIDGLAREGKLVEDAVAFARQVLAEGKPLLRVRDRQDKVEAYRGKPEIYADYLKRHADAFRGLIAPVNIVEAIKAAAELPFEQGLARERELFQELVNDSQSATQRYYFFAERQTVKVPGIATDAEVRPVAKVAVVGDGDLADDIADTFGKAGVSAIRLATTPEQSGFAVLADADLVIEAVDNEIHDRKMVFGKLGSICRKGAILVSATAGADLTEVAAVSARPKDVIGVRFSGPKNSLRLLEVVRGSETADDVVISVMKLAKMIGKVPV